MASERNINLLEKLQATLNERENFIITAYTGLNVPAQNEVRKALRDSGGSFKVVKNNLFRIALKKSSYHEAFASEFDGMLEGPNAIIFANGDFPAIGKALLKIVKEKEQIVIKGGCFEGRSLKKEEVIEIASLPGREELLTIIGRGLNTPAQKIAIGMKEVIASLARGIKSIGEKNG